MRERNTAVGKIDPFVAEYVVAIRKEFTLGKNRVAGPATLDGQPVDALRYRHVRYGRDCVHGATPVRGRRLRATSLAPRCGSQLAASPTRNPSVVHVR